MYTMSIYFKCGIQLPDTALYEHFLCGQLVVFTRSFLFQPKNKGRIKYPRKVNSEVNFVHYLQIYRYL